MNNSPKQIKAIIGLGNPGVRYRETRHNIGFMVIDALAERYHTTWQHKDEMDVAQIQMNGQPVLLIKPQTFMNSSGRVFPFLAKKGIKAEQLLVIHDELEKPFGSLAFKEGGSARGHNGLRSIIGAAGPDFLRLRFGIGRPELKEQVGDYVLERFDIETQQLAECIEEAVVMIELLFKEETLDRSP